MQHGPIECCWQAKKTFDIDSIEKLQDELSDMMEDSNEIQEVCLPRSLPSALRAHTLLRPTKRGLSAAARLAAEICSPSSRRPS